MILEIEAINTKFLTRFQELGTLKFIILETETT